MFSNFASSFFSLIALVAVVVFSTSGSVGTVNAQDAPGDTTDEASMLQKASKVFGYNAVGKLMFEMKRQGLDLDNEMVLEGATLAATGKDLGMSQEEVTALVSSLQTVMREKQTKMLAEAAVKNKADGEAYMAENAKKEGVKMLDNGVQYEVLVNGSGPKPGPSDKVKIHYTGTTTQGKVFDSSVQKGEPLVSSASGFVKGFNAAVQAMNVGSKWRVTIPSDLAYGMSGPLGPNRTLNFEIELIEIVKE